MKLHIAVVDDNSSVIELISGTIQNGFQSYGIETEIDTFSSCSRLEEKRKEAIYDIIFLDINMPEMDGIDYARLLRNQETESKIIFVSSREERVFEAIQIQPFGFVRKSSFLNDISEVISRYVKAKKNDDTITNVIFTVHGKKKAFTLKTIAYFEGCGSHQELHFVDRKDVEEISSSMETLEKELTPHAFLRVHKGYLVNFFAITGFEGADAILVTGERIPISRRKLQTVKTDFMELCKKYNVLTF